MYYYDCGDLASLNSGELLKDIPTIRINLLPFIVVANSLISFTVGKFDDSERLRPEELNQQNIEALVAENNLVSTIIFLIFYACTCSSIWNDYAPHIQWTLDWLAYRIYFLGPCK